MAILLRSASRKYTPKPSSVTTSRCFVPSDIAQILSTQPSNLFRGPRIVLTLSSSFIDIVISFRPPICSGLDFVLAAFQKTNSLLFVKVWVLKPASQVRIVPASFRFGLSAVLQFYLAGRYAIGHLQHPTWQAIILSLSVLFKFLQLGIILKITTTPKRPAHRNTTLSASNTFHFRVPFSCREHSQSLFWCPHSSHIHLRHLL